MANSPANISMLGEILLTCLTIAEHVIFSDVGTISYSVYENLHSLYGEGDGAGHTHHLVSALNLSFKFRRTIVN